MWDGEDRQLKSDVDDMRCIVTSISISDCEGQ